MSSINRSGLHITSAFMMSTIVFFGFGTVNAVAAACGSGTPAVSTDKQDYPPSATAAISGSGFACGQVLSVLVTAPDGTTRSGNGAGSAGPDSVTTDGNGAFVLSYALSGTLPGGGTYTGQLGAYRVAVVNSSSVVLARAAFTDGQSFHTCALTTSGGVKCWGQGNSGQVGNGTYADSPTPVDVTGLTSGVAQITLGDYHTCALTTNGGVKCWGRNLDGQLGNGTQISSALPVDVIGLTSGVAQISAGESYTCAVMTSGGAKCWGGNYSGELGNGTYVNSAAPVDVTGLTSGVAQISTGEGDTCVVTTSGGAKCWGYNGTGQLGNGTYGDSATPGDVTGLASGTFQIRVGSSHVCALTTNGGAKCWGDNYYGELGVGAFPTAYPYGSAVPVDVSGLTSGVAQISPGGLHTCALTTSGSVQCWGYNIYGSLGNGTNVNSAAPVNVIGLASGIAQISTGYFHACGLTTGGGVKCWGYDGNGELGDGMFQSLVPKPVDVIGLTGGAIALPDAPGSIAVLDAIAPTASPITQLPAANIHGWNNSDVTVTWNWTDNAGGSGIDTANCTTSSISSGEGTAVNVAATCNDLAGNTGHASYTVKVDKTNPTITPTATKADSTAYTSGTWTNQTVTVHYTCGDSLSGVATCPTDQIFSANGSTSTNGTATDMAGNSASSSFVLVQVDKTAPALSPVISPNPVLLNGLATAISGATDGLSGLALQGCGAVVTASAGLKTVTCTATDNAGNTNSAIVSYVVNYTFSGFLAPVNNLPVINTGKAGKTYPVKWQLTDTNGAYVSALTAAASITFKSTSCSAFTGDPTDALETSASGGTSLRYDSTANQYVYNWSTPPAGCYTLFLTLDSGQVFSADFNLTK
jgi:alpha-tubulin suppressor-like RCC1 family protein